MLHTFNRFIACLLIVCTIGIGLPLPASAGIVATGQVTASIERDKVNSFLARADVQAQLRTHGVDAATAQQRIDALSDQEVAQLAGRIDALPAGGDGVGAVLGFLLVVFIVLLVTDILGLTKVFPFTRSVR